jgi:cytochrome c oxidase assembly protein subunit 11
MGNNKRNVSLALSLSAIVAGMLMLAYASVPLYRLFCQTTGFGGVAQVTKISSPNLTSERIITVRFDANVSPVLPWFFAPATQDISLHIGEQKQINYIAKNLGSRTVTGTATFNITPVKAGKYFNKIQCFCFTEQLLKPHEKKNLGVTFFIDPAINNDPDLDDVHTITLSYTFFPLQK